MPADPPRTNSRPGECQSLRKCDHFPRQDDLGIEEWGREEEKERAYSLKLTNLTGYSLCRPHGHEAFNPIVHIHSRIMAKWTIMMYGSKDFLQL